MGNAATATLEHEKPNGQSEAATESEPEIGAEVGIHTQAPATGWFARVLRAYLRHREATKHARANQPIVGTKPDRAQAAIRRACIQSSLTGASTGIVSTAATLVTAGTEGVGGLVAVPVAALTIGGEMALRTWIHIDLICTLADIFEVKFEATNKNDMWRLCALAFGAHDEETSEEDPGKKLVHELVHIEPEEIGEEIGQKILGESVMRNIVPVFGIAASAVTNWRLTRKLGDTARRYMRYHRAMSDALDEAITACSHHLELLIEGMWFVFIADGQLSPEESAILAGFLTKFQNPTRHEIQERFVEDEYGWLERLAPAMPDMEDRQALYHALEVAAAVDKEVGLAERRLLRSAARRLGIAYDPKSTETLIEQFENQGVLEG
jgi:hypothetical protein